MEGGTVSGLKYEISQNKIHSRGRYQQRNLCEFIFDSDF